ncbi:MAG: hypothetical protein MZV70_49030 [Desulfobacterales bacterium]|nr:hypothetical protein [Desulfobacterales bacterium]
MHSESIRELSETFGSEMKPILVEFEGQTYELTGPAEEQFKRWRELLREIYRAETGFGGERAASTGFQRVASFNLRWTSINDAAAGGNASPPFGVKASGQARKAIRPERHPPDGRWPERCCVAALTAARALVDRTTSPAILGPGARGSRRRPRSLPFRLHRPPPAFDVFRTATASPQPLPPAPT